MEPALSQFISVVSHSPAIHLGCVSNLLFGTLRLLLGPLNLSFLLWAKEAQFLQPLPTGHTVQPSDHLGDSAGLTQGHLRDPHIGNPQIDDFLTEGKERKGKGARTLPIPMMYFLGLVALQQQGGLFICSLFPKSKQSVRQQREHY